MKAYETDCNLDRICGMSNYDHIFGGPIANTQFHITGNMPITTPQPPTVEKVDSMTITEFLEARIAEDEADALPFRNELGDTKQWRCDEVGGVVRYVGPMAFRLPDRLGTFDTHLEAAHVGRWHPSRVLAECAAKRAILADRARIDRSAGMDDWYAGYSDANHDAVRALAAIYSDHPDYQQEWAL